MGVLACILLSGGCSIQLGIHSWKRRMSLPLVKALSKTVLSDLGSCVWQSYTGLSHTELRILRKADCGTSGLASTAATCTCLLN